SVCNIGKGMTYRRPTQNGIATAPSAEDDRPSPRLNPVKRFLKILGPGLITGASDDDPSGIGTYAMAGASFGYGMLWTALFTFPLMASIQLICARIGLVCGCGLAEVMRRHYPPTLVYVLVLSLVIANTIIASVVLAAIAAGVSFLLPLPIPF